MNTPSKLTPEQIAAGWIEIESEGQLERIVDEFCDFLHRNGAILKTLSCTHSAPAFEVRVWRADTLPGTWSAAQITKGFIAYRPVPNREEVEALRKQVVDKNLEIERLTGDFKALVKEYEQLAAANNGKTLRDEIAIAALATPYADNGNCNTADKIAEDAYRIAGAMLEARKGGGE